MLRQIHKLPGLIAGLLVVVLATSGTILSVIPALDRSIVPPSSFNQMNVAELAGRISKNYPGAEQIKRSPSGKITVFYFKNDNAGADLIDPATGAKVAAYQPSGFVRWLKLFHRSLLFDNNLSEHNALLTKRRQTLFLQRKISFWRPSVWSREPCSIWR